VRAALKVELGGRLLATDAPPPAKFVLASVGCVGDNVELLIVRQDAGSPARREVPLTSLAADARPRAVAIAIAELLRVDLTRNSTPPADAAPVPARGTVIAISATPVLFSRYFSGVDQHWFSGAQFRVAVESPTRPVPERRWGWDVAYELNLAGPDSRFDFMSGVSALGRWQGGPVVPEIALGARIGPSWDYSNTAPSPTEILWGPFASVAIDIRWYGRCSSRAAGEGGFDFGGRGGGWGSLIISITCRF
jgi:hypothetical protein